MPESRLKTGNSLNTQQTEKTIFIALGDGAEYFYFEYRTKFTIEGIMIKTNIETLKRSLIVVERSILTDAKEDTILLWSIV